MLTELLRKTAATLKSNNIPYMVIGGQAALIYGNLRFTRDIDISLGLDSDNLHLILKIIDDIQLKPIVENPEEFVSKTSTLPVIDQQLNVRIDFIFSFIQFENEAISRCNKILVDDTEYAFTLWTI